MKRVVNYWKEFFIDLKIWRKFRKVARENKELLLKNNMRVDWLGRIYTVANMPEEVISNGLAQVQQGWVLSQLGPLNDVLMKIGISDYAYPEINYIPDSQSYLIVMYPEIDSLNPWRIIWNILGLGLIGSLIYISYKLLMHFEVVDMIKSIF